MGLKNLYEKLEISSVFNELVSHIRSLESLGITLKQTTLFLFPMVSSLIEDILIAWQRNALYEKDASKARQKLDFLLEFLQQELGRLAKFGFLLADYHQKQVQSKKVSTVSTAAGLHVGELKNEFLAKL